MPFNTASPPNRKRPINKSANNTARLPIPPTDANTNAGDADVAANSTADVDVSNNLDSYFPNYLKEDFQFADEVIKNRSPAIRPKRTKRAGAVKSEGFYKLGKKTFLKGFLAYIR